MGESSKTTEHGLKPYLSPLSVWAIALGASIGWGSFVITCNTYLSQAGPAGSIGGMAIGALIMVVISRNYHYLMNRFPSAGGAYTYTKRLFGMDAGFLIAWFLGLTYIAIFWANATSVPLFARYFFGDIFRFGHLYSLFGYDVYFGEALLSIAAIVAACLVCAFARKGLAHLLTALAAVFFVGITACFAVTMFKLDVGFAAFDPAFVPDKAAFDQLLRIACISPWAFIGFESISHSVEEFSFDCKKTFRILTVAIVSITLLYAFVMLLSISTYPPEYSSWLAYLGDLGNIQGLKGVPAFYAAQHYLGSTGIAILTLSLFALIASSLVCMLIALSRLVYVLAKDSVVPPVFGTLSSKGIPQNALLLVGAVSCLIPFLGRTAIGWIVDVTTLGATIIFVFVSAAAFMAARQDGSRVELCTGLAGTALMVLFAIMLLFPSFTGSNSMASESYFLFAVWALLGFVLFRIVLQKDPNRRFGKSVIVWIALLSLVFFTAMTWMGQADQEATNAAINEIHTHFALETDNPVASEESSFVEHALENLNRTKNGNTFLVMGLLALSFAIMLSNFSFLHRREEESVRELGEVKSVAYKDALTGVKSKHAFAEWEDKLDMEISNNVLDKFAVVVFDVNGLKQVNDTQGHKAGDAYIRSACMLVCDVFKHSPVFRIGGDEFVAILQGDDYANRQELLATFDRTVEGNIGTSGPVVSAGIADFVAGQDVQAHAVFERADAQMYERKRELKSKGAVTRD